MKKLKQKNEELKLLEKKIYPLVDKLFENKFGYENKNNLFSGIVAGFVVSMFIILMELFKEIFKFLNIESWIFLIYLSFLSLFWIVIRKFSDYFLQIKK